MAQSDRPALGEYLRTETGIPHTYFNPDANVNLKYPCIIYSRDGIEKRHADNGTYILTHRYQLMLIDRDPDSVYVEKIELLPMCRFSRHYVSDNLSHDIFTIYFK